MSKKEQNTEILKHKIQIPTTKTNILSNLSTIHLYKSRFHRFLTLP